MVQTQTEMDLLNIMRNLDESTASVVLAEVPDEVLCAELFRRLDKRKKQLSDIFNAVSI